ncbi:PIG-M-domain-containing protein [Blastocladiella britannica]|nr:PIG-M-domain-containing protein [Blastocladiella britannica]
MSAIKTLPNSNKDKTWPWLLVAGTALRIGMLIYGAWQDANLPVPYTDIDYRVFTDAAAAVAKHGSPYDRATYRYTPLLAWLLVPQIWLGWDVWGKLLFVAADLVTAVVVRALTIDAIEKQSHGERNGKARASWLTAACWLLNPFVANISTRGSAESIMCALCTAVALALARGRTTTAAVLFGVAVHLKIYPVLYVVPVMVATLVPPNGGWSWQRVRAAAAFAGTSFATFAALAVIMVGIYGRPFVDHAYLYHVTRSDHRHNFSVWWYALSLRHSAAAATSGSATSAAAVPVASAAALIPFAAQLLVTLALGIKYARTDLVVAMWAQTFAFVAFNKVMTSQYFMWWLCYLPVVIVYLRPVSWRRAATWVGVWVGAQGLWLSFAFQLEFRAAPVYKEIFYASVALFAVHIGLLVQAIRLIAAAAADPPIAAKKKSE